MSYVKTYAMILGWVFIAIGAVGFILTGFGDFFGMEGDHLLFFEINPAHNVVHLGIGALGFVVLAWDRRRATASSATA